MLHVPRTEQCQILLSLSILSRYGCSVSLWFMVNTHICFQLLSENGQVYRTNIDALTFQTCRCVEAYFVPLTYSPYWQVISLVAVTKNLKKENPYCRLFAKFIQYSERKRISERTDATFNSVKYLHALFFVLEIIFNKLDAIF